MEITFTCYNDRYFLDKLGKIIFSKSFPISIINESTKIIALYNNHIYSFSVKIYSISLAANSAQLHRYKVKVIFDITNDSYFTSFETRNNFFD